MIRMLAPLALGLAAISPAAAKGPPVTDCPNRDAPFSVSAPMLDLMLSPAARAVIERETGKPMGGSGVGPPMGTEPPTFAAILTLKEAGRFIGGIDDAKLARIDAELRKLPVTAADRRARCARYDNEVPRFVMPKGKPRLLMFEKINGFRDVPSVNAAHAALEAMARRKGWALVTTEKGGAFNARTLGQFDAVIWNNISGDVLTLSQRAAFKRWLEAGGGFVAVHGSAGDPVYFWDWYPDKLIGARFAGHPMSPQFQDARIVSDPSHPLSKAVPREWVMNDEWYSFKTNPRAAGAKVLLTLDESTYQQAGPMGMSLSMGADHPLAWTNCIGRGRMFYSAIGHRAETYAHPNYVALLEAAIPWAASKGTACK